MTIGCRYASAATMLTREIIGRSLGKRPNLRISLSARSALLSAIGTACPSLTGSASFSETGGKRTVRSAVSLRDRTLREQHVMEMRPTQPRDLRRSDARGQTHSLTLGGTTGRRGKYSAWFARKPFLHGRFTPTSPWSCRGLSSCSRRLSARFSPRCSQDLLQLGLACLSFLRGRKFSYGPPRAVIFAESLDDKPSRPAFDHTVDHVEHVRSVACCCRVASRDSLKYRIGAADLYPCGHFLGTRGRRSWRVCVS
jgi:hypothetical protein